MKGTEKWFTKATVTTDLVILLSVFGAGSAITQAVIADTPAYSMDGLPSVLDRSVSDRGAPGDPGTGMNHAAQELGIQGEVEELQQFSNGVMGQQGGTQESLSFRELMRGLIKGNLKGILEQAGVRTQDTLLSEARGGGHILFQVAAIGIIGAVSSNASSVFKGGQISDMGFFMTYVFLFTCLAASLAANLQVTARVLNQTLEFMKLMILTCFMSMAFPREGVGALVLYGGVLGVVTLIQQICNMVLLSMVKIYMLIVLGNHVAKGTFLTELTGLLEQTVEWGLGTLTDLVMGFHLIQSMILPYASTVGRVGVRRLLEVIPGLGQGVGTMIQMVLGSGILIKNAMEAAAVVVLVVITVIPIIKFTVFVVFYQCVTVVVQPVYGKRVVSCTSGVSEGCELLIQIVLYFMFLFMVSVTITCISTNVNYFAS